MRTTRSARPWAGLLWLVALAVTSSASAQATGYELALSGPNQALVGEHLRLSGTVYEVSGLASLRPLPGGVVEATLYRYREDRTRENVVQGSFAADRDGRVSIDLLVPEVPVPTALNLELMVGRRGDTNKRTIQLSYGVGPSLRFDLVTDRQRYEPGETIHAFSLLRRLLNGMPVTDAAVRLSVRAPNGTLLADRRIATRASGAVFADVALDARAVDGNYTVSVTYEGRGGPVTASRTVQVGQRTVERMLVDVEIAAPVVAPGAAITGRARVRTASGAPIAGASVTATIAGNAVRLASDAEGIATFSVAAPAFLSGDVANASVDVRVEHAAYGMRRETVPVVIARSPYRVEIVEHGHALVPEVPTRIYVHVTDPLGRPAPEGTEVEVVGTSVASGRQLVRVDRDGFAEVPMLVRVGAASTIRQEGPCNGEIGISFDVTLTTPRRMTTASCAQVAPDAMVAVRAAAPVTTPGGTLEIEVARRPEVASAVVAVDLLFERRIVGSVFVPAGQSTARIALPSEIAGWVQLRARPLGRHDVVPALESEGAVTYGTGSSDAVLVRPADAFSLTLDAGDEVLPVRGRATVRLHTSSVPTRAFYTMVARDLAMHGGESDYTIAWLVRFFDAAATSPTETGRDRLVRATLIAALTPDDRARGVAPLVTPPWDEEGYGGTHPNLARGELRDPLRLRDEMLRRTAGALMVRIEGLVNEEIALGPDDERSYTVRGGGFAPNLIARMIEQGTISVETAATLGGRPMTLAMLQSADPSFRFETVAARLCRARLAKLMLALMAFTNPDVPTAARAIEGVPPTRWLSRLVELGMVEPNDLLDPWGRAFVFRPAARGTPRVVLSDRAPTYELLSAGNDGRVGSGDDVRDPFARVLPQGSVYAVASGEDQLMRSIASIAPGEETLRAMLSAYDTLSVAAMDESRESAVSATASEEMMPAEFEGAMPPSAVTDAYGIGGGGIGQGYGRGSGSMSSRSRAAAPMVPGATDSEADDQDAPAGSTLRRVGEMVRERFPATLIFVGERALEAVDSTIEIPLQDALTTYRTEAIAWTASGWVTCARTEFRVDQEATIDAVVPEFATVGDSIRVPVRIENRTANPLAVRMGFEAEGLAVEGGAVRTVEVPARGVREEIVPLTMPAIGSGQIVARLVRAADDGALDAVRRPITVYADARLVRETRRIFVEGPSTATVEVPADASERGAGEIRIASGFDFFGELPAEDAPSRIDRAWARDLAGLPVAEEDRAIAVEVLEALVDEDHIPGPIVPVARIIFNDPTRLARTLAIAWGSPAFERGIGLRALERLARDLPETDDRGNTYEPQLFADATRLLALAPIVGEGGAHAEELGVFVRRLRAIVSNSSARTMDVPALAVMQAAALANTDPTRRDARAEEILRRLERIIVRGGDGRFLEGNDVGQPHARELPTALLALVYLGRGDRAAAFDALRGLATRPERTLQANARIFAAAAAGALLSRAGTVPVSASFDGRGIELAEEHGVRTGTIAGLGRPGRHAITIGIPQDGAAWIELDVRYGRPWTGAEARRLPITIEVKGELGARDTRAGLSIELRNQGARVLRRPVVEVDLPAGAELDEPARRALAQMTRSEPTIEGRTLRLSLRPMAPGARIRLPLGLRWTVAGTMRGLGVTAYDDAPTVGGVIARSVVPSRAIELADHGAEPEAATGETEEPPPPPPPPPMPLLRTLAPADEVSR